MPLEKNKLNIEKFAALCEKTPPIQADSMARKFVSQNPDNIDAWLILFSVLIRSGSHLELERLSLSAMQNFGNKQKIFQYHIHALLLNKRFELAKNKLVEKILTQQQASTEREILLLAELMLINDPKQSSLLFSAVLERSPNNLFARMGKLSAKSLIENTNTKPKASLFCLFDWHFWIQESIADAFIKNKQPFYSLSNVLLHGYFKCKFSVLSEANTDIIPKIRSLSPQSKIVDTRHGININGKNYGLYSSSVVDYVCVSSEYIAKELGKQALLPSERIWVTGYPQMDKVFQNTNNNGITQNAVLFSPTFSPEMSAAFLIGSNPVYSIRGNNKQIKVILNPHPHLLKHQPEMIKEWQQIAKLEPNVEFISSTNINIVDLFDRVDLMISDVSSVTRQFLATGKPLIRLVNPKNSSKYTSYDGDSFEWTISTVAQNISDSNLLHSLVERTLLSGEPENIKESKAAFLLKLYGTLTDGAAGTRIARKIMEL